MHNGRDIIFVFDGSFDGFLNTIHAYYYEKLVPRFIYNERPFQGDGFQQVLDSEYIYIDSDGEKAEKVFTAIKRNMSAAENLYNAFLNNDEGKYIDLFKYALLGFKVKGLLDNYKQLDYVLNTQKYAQAVTCEAHLLKGFCRFSETAQKIYYAKITPKHNVLPIISEHFAERLAEQKWIIHDVKRGIASLYDTSEWYIADVGQFANIEFSENEQGYQRMWKTFCGSIAIQERKNIKLQKQFIRRHHRLNMIEFTKPLE